MIIPALCRQRIKNIGQDDFVFLVICSPRFTEDVYEDLDGVDDGEVEGSGGVKTLVVILSCLL